MRARAEPPPSPLAVLSSNRIEGNAGRACPADVTDLPQIARETRSPPRTWTAETGLKSLRDPLAHQLESPTIRIRIKWIRSSVKVTVHYFVFAIRQACIRYSLLVRRFVMPFWRDGRTRIDLDRVSSSKSWIINCESCGVSTLNGAFLRIAKGESHRVVKSFEERKWPRKDFRVSARRRYSSRARRIYCAVFRSVVMRYEKKEKKMNGKERQHFLNRTLSTISFRRNSFDLFRNVPTRISVTS